jgi:CDGSH-type Zn-finger protein
VVVLPVDERDLHGRAPELPNRLQPAEATAYDDHTVSHPTASIAHALPQRAQLTSGAMPANRDRMTKEYATDEIVVEWEPSLCFHSQNCVRLLPLCRCGGSMNEPFCDGTHKTNGFCG